MRGYRYILFMLALLFGVGMRGQYNPDNPAEPGVYYTLTLEAVPSDAGSFNISTPGAYSEGSKVGLRASARSGFVFVAWEEGGKQIAASPSFTYTMPARNVRLTARYRYDPASPGEPSEPALPVYSVLGMSVSPADGGYLNIPTGNKYAVGTSVSLTAYANSNFTFKHWTENGEVVSTSRSFNYVMKAGNPNLVAHYVYEPSSPGEPSEPRVYHKLYLQNNPAEGGYFNLSSGNAYQEGAVVQVTATPYSQYTFRNWTQGDKVISTNSRLDFTMPAADATLTANYDYTPTSPEEPGRPSVTSSHIYGMTENGVQGQTIVFPVYLENAVALKGMVVDVHFPTGFAVNTADVWLTGRASDHKLEVTSLGDNGFRFSVLGTEPFEGDNGKVFDVPVTIPDTATMGRNYAVALSHGVAHDVDDKQTAVKVRSGYIFVKKVAEDGLYAQFSYDKYQNRVKFSNLSSDKAVRYLWDFGDGSQSTDAHPIHKYEKPGYYDVTLTAYGQTSGDVAQTTVLINEESTWKAQGTYYLSRQIDGVRYFDHLGEMLDMLSHSTVDGDVSIAVQSGEVFDCSFADLERLLQLQPKFAAYGLSFIKQGEGENPVLHFSDEGSAAYDAAILNTFADARSFTDYTDVGVRLWDVNLNTSSRMRYIVEDGIIFSEERTEIVRYPADKTGETYKIPASVTAISSEAFRANSALRQIVMHGGITRIGAYAFADCSGLRMLTIPDGVTEIEEYTFHNCKGLSLLTIGSRVVRLADGALQGCGNLSEVISLNPEAPANARFEQAVYERAVLSVPKGALEAYRSADGWKAFRNVQELDYVVLDDGSVVPLMQGVAMELADPAQWNAEGAYGFNVSGVLFNQEGKDAQLFCYADGGTPKKVTDMLHVGDAVSAVVSVAFAPEKTDEHTIVIYAQDAEGNKLSAKIYRYPIVSSMTVKGIEEYEYTGEPIVQSDWQLCSPDGRVVLTDGQFAAVYSDNIVPGTAKVEITGQYPYSFGRMDWAFTIVPAQLNGTITLPEERFVYSGTAIMPEVTYDDERFGLLTAEEDYTVSYENNIYPGQAEVILTGVGKFHGEVRQAFQIEKAPLDASHITCTIPSEVIIYDGEGHGAEVAVAEGIDSYLVYYVDASGKSSTNLPVNPGVYTVSVEVTRSRYFQTGRIDLLGQFTIQMGDTKEWDILVQFHSSMKDADKWTHPWDMEAGVGGIANLYGVTITDGHVTGIDLSRNNVSGNFPYILLTLPYLEKLDLSDNALSGLVEQDVEQYRGMVSESVVSLNLSHNSLEGDVAVLANSIASLKELNASYNRLSRISVPLGNADLKLDITYQKWPDVVKVNFADGAEAKVEGLPEMMAYEEAVSGGWAMRFNAATLCELMLEQGRDGLSLTCPSGKNIYKGQSGSVMSAMATSRLTYGSTFSVQLDFAEGDANFDAETDVVDLQAMINFAFGSYPAFTPFNFTAANLFGDELINVQDVVNMVTLLLSHEPVAGTRAGASYINKVGRRDGNAGNVQPDAYVYCENGRVVLHTSVPVAALDVALDHVEYGNVEWLAEDLGLEVSVRTSGNRKRAIMYSLDNGMLPAGETVIATYNKGTTPVVRALCLSDEAAGRLHAVAGKPDFTGVEALPQGGTDCLMTDGKIVLRAGEELRDVVVSVFTTSGLLVGQQRFEAVSAGESRVVMDGDKTGNGIFILQISVSGQTPVTKKISMR